MKPFLMPVGVRPDCLDCSVLSKLSGGFVEDSEEDFRGKRGGLPSDHNQSSGGKS